MDWLIVHLANYARAKELQVAALEGQATTEKARGDDLQARLDALEKASTDATKQPEKPAGQEVHSAPAAGS